MIGKINSFIQTISNVTRYIVYGGMLAAIACLLSGAIIYHSHENFNNNLSNFALGEQLMVTGYAFIICTLITAALSEYCMRQIQKNSD